MIPHDTHLQIGSLLFDGLDQIDLTGPFEVLSRIPNSTYRLYGKTAEPVRDVKGLRLTPDAALSVAPQLDVLRYVLALCSAARRGCSRDGERRRIGRRFTCCRTSVRSPSTSGWSWTATGFSPQASRPASTVPCGSPPSCAVTTPRGPSNSTWCTRRSRRSTAARRKPHPPRSLRMLANRSPASPHSAKRAHGASPATSASKFPSPCHEPAVGGKRWDFGKSAKASSPR